MRNPTRLPVLGLLLALAAGCNGGASGAGDLVAAGPDLISPVARDLAAPPDLAATPDLATGRDLAAPPADLAPGPDLARAPDLSGGNEPCTAAGATVGTQLCCLATSDFPNLCAIGACSCAPMNSHMIRVCVCPGNKCWNGTACQ